MSKKPTNKIPSPTTRLNTRKELFFAALIFIGALLFHYREVVFENGTFVMGSAKAGITNTIPYQYPGAPPIAIFLDSSAIAYHHEPYSYWVNQMFAQGEFPLWNPNQGLGIPAFASLQSAILDPLMALVHFSPISMWPYMMDIQLLIRYFLAGLFTYMFMRSLNVGYIGSVAAGLSFMLAPTIVILGNIVYARSILFFPLLMYSFQKLAKQPGWQAHLLSIASIWLIVATGFPEILPLYIGFAVIWYFIEAREYSYIFRIKQVAVIGGISLLLSAVFLVPFGEYFMMASTRETAIFAPATISEIAQLLAMFLVPLRWTYPYTFLYIFSSSWLMGISAIFSHTNREYTIKFLSFAALLIAIAIRIPVLNILNNLGIFSGIIIRFAPPIVTFLIACASGIGIDSWVIGKLSPRAVFLTGTMIIGYILIVNRFFLQENDKVLQLPYFIPAVMFVLVIYILITYLNSGFLLRIRAPFIIFSLMFITAWWSINYFFYPQRYDPFTKPPYVAFLEKQDPPFRVLGLDDFLYPNTATSVGLQDIRYLDALLPKRLTSFAKTMLFNPVGESRFLGTEEIIYFERGLDLSNVKYIIADASNDSIFGYINLTIDGPTEIKQINGIERKIISPQDDDRIIASGIVKVIDPQLSIGFGVDPEFWQCDCQLEDGIVVKVTINAKEAKSNDDIWNLIPNRFNSDVKTSEVVKIFEKRLYPLQNTADRIWFKMQFDLSEWRGQLVDITFQQKMNGEASNLIYWEVPKLYSASDGSEGSSYPLAYQDNMVSIYSNPEAFPRAYLVHQFEVIEQPDDILTRLVSDDFDPYNSVILETSPPIKSKENTVTSHKGERFESAKLLEQRADLSRFSIRAQSPGLMVVSEQYFPGWKAYIDGVPTTLYAANLTMRAVYLDAGEHVIEFVYRPVSFRIGLIISGVGLLILLIYILYLNKRVHN